MINRTRVTEAFDAYAGNYDLSDPKVKLKVDHTYRVASLCDLIADSIKLTGKAKDLAWLSGMLHDFGRFEQVRRYHTFIDKNSCNHAALSADLLFKEGLIRLFADPKDLTPAEITTLEKAIRLHNVLRLPDSLSMPERVYCNLLRDADKIDILRVNCESSRSDIYDIPEEDFYTSDISGPVLMDVLNERTVDRRNSKTGIDYILGHISFVFGLFFSASIVEMKRQGYLDQLLNFETKNPEAALKMQKVRHVVDHFIQDTAKNT